jgi:hypothetical protein
MGSEQVMSPLNRDTETQEMDGIVKKKEWEKRHEDILKEWKAKAFVNLWLQTMSGYYYARVHDILTYPVIILSSVSSATLFSTKSVILQYMIGVMSIMTGVLTAVTRQVKPGELYQQYSAAKVKYQKLIRNIDMCLDLPESMRPKPEVFVEKIESDIDSLSASELYPPHYIVKKFEEKFGNLDTMLFGHDIVELLAKDLKNKKKFRALAKIQSSKTRSP